MSIFEVVTKLFKSKALIIGWLTFVFGLLNYLSADPLISKYPEFVSVAISVSGVLQVIVRWLTTLPLSDK